jgi:hypothetical protein
MSRKPLWTGTGLLVGMAVALTGATLANVTGAAAAVQEDKAAQGKGRRVCRTVTPSGSRLTRRVCRSQADWDSSREKAQDGALEYQIGQSTGLTPDPNLSPMPNPNLPRPNRP